MKYITTKYTKHTKKEALGSSGVLQLNIPDPRIQSWRWTGEPDYGECQAAWGSQSPRRCGKDAASTMHNCAPLNKSREKREQTGKFGTGRSHRTGSRQHDDFYEREDDEDEPEKVRAFDVDPAPLKISRGFSKARGTRQPRAFEKRSAPLNFSGKMGDQAGVVE